MKPFACATIYGNKDHPDLIGKASFYENISGGIWVELEVTGLPDMYAKYHSQFYGLHLHETGDCTPPFDKTGAHYNPSNMPHPYHAGDLPPLLGNNGYAFSLFYTNRLKPVELIGKSIIIHSNADDFTTQPSGNSGDKIGCGVIREC